tara:strand:- start:493 stop:699 length:207 start_codon:yes stop_codon:yes gene_type:complete
MNKVELINMIASELKRKGVHTTTIQAGTGLSKYAIDAVLSQSNDPKLKTVTKLAESAGLRLTLEIIDE